jgi:tetratricopeptide (TPR) repeat protein
MSEDKPEKPKGFWTWDRSIEILKIVATVYAACIGTFVTMQFNDRQHELARLEAIAKMLPHLADHATDSVSAPAPVSAILPMAKGSTAPAEPVAAPAAANTSSSTNRMMRDGAIWAIFRTANNKTMLCDLAALFPEDIYRVVSSIAAAGNLSGDKDALTALQVASEKMANKYTDSGVNPALAGRLYSQALRLKRRADSEQSGGALYVVDLNESEIAMPHDDTRQLQLLQSLNQLAELHYTESETSKNVNTGHFQAKQLYKRVISNAQNSAEPESLLEVAKAQIGLARVYAREKDYKDAITYMRDALAIREKYLGKSDRLVADLCIDMANILRMTPDGAAEADKLEARASAILKTANSG